MKAINVLAMSAAAIPVFLWTRRLAGRGWALGAAGLTLLLPGLAYTTALMTENLFLPLFVTATYAVARGAPEPTGAPEPGGLQGGRLRIGPLVGLSRHGYLTVP
jgi:hypothetical protein